MISNSISTSSSQKQLLKHTLTDKQLTLFVGLNKIKSPTTRVPSIGHNRSDTDIDYPNIDKLLRRISELESLLKLKDKEIRRLTNINQFLMNMNANKEAMIQDERKNLQKIKERVHQEKDSKHSQKQILEPINLLPKMQLRHSNLFDGLNFLTSIGNQPEFCSQQDIKQAVISEEQFKLSGILDLEAEDRELQETFHNDPQYKFLNGLIQDEEKFLTIVQQSGVQKILFIYEKLKRLFTEHNHFFQTMLRIKQLIKAAIQMNTVTTLDEALEKIIQQCLKCMNCDRASCFIFDEQKGQLWSKVAKGVTGVIRIQLKQGVVGHVAYTRRLLNIQNAYQDPRFNPDFDKMTHYKTNNILCLPILKKDHCLGVIQLINKNDGHFNREDEFFGSILCEFSMSVLSRAIVKDETILAVGKLRQCVKLGINMKKYRDHSLVEKLFIAEKSLKNLMNVEEARVVALQGQTLVFTQDNGTLDQCEGFHSLLGQAMQSQKTTIVSNCYDHQNFSPHIDLQTSLPVVSIPVFNNKREIIGGFQIPNVRGIQNLVAQMEPRLQPIDEEVLEAFSQQLTDLLE